MNWNVTKWKGMKISRERCIWKLDGRWQEYYETSCGHAFYFADGTEPYDEQSNFKFCPYCGKKIKVDMESIK